MQDRFKFRAISMSTKEITYIDSFYWFEENGVREIDSNNTTSGVVAEYWINQCTGLKDDNGKLIYEGDIVKTLYTKPNGEIINRICVVEFNRCAFWINYGIGASYLDNDDCIYKVVGNIYENKELLNELHS